MVPETPGGGRSASRDTGCPLSYPPAPPGPAWDPPGPDRGYGPGRSGGPDMRSAGGREPFRNALPTVRDADLAAPGPDGLGTGGAGRERAARTVQEGKREKGVERMEEATVAKGDTPRDPNSKTSRRIAAWKAKRAQMRADVGSSGYPTMLIVSFPVELLQ
jgi:hypothetical protein